MDKEYGKYSRVEIRIAAERAAVRIAADIVSYVRLHEIEPSVSISGRLFPIDYCASMVRTWLEKEGIKSQVFGSSNGHIRDINFNLDEVVEKLERESGEDILD